MSTNNAINSQDPIQVALGGTGLATLTAHSLQVGNGTGTVTQLGVATNGQLPIGSTGADPVLAAITAGTNISVTNGAGSITIAATGAGSFTWNDVTGTSASMGSNMGYVADNAGLVTLTLPASATFGATISVLGKGAGGWKIAQNAGQFINFGSVVTTVGTGGSLASTNAFDSVTFVCTTAGASTGWGVTDSIGNITYV